MKFFDLLTNKKSILILFLIFLGFNFYFLIQFQKLNEIAQQEVQILDLRFGYSIDEVNLFFEQLGSEGRMLYAKISQADMFYPIAYGLLIISLLSFFTKQNSKLLVINTFPIIAVIIDYFENIYILKLMVSFPEMKNELVLSTSMLTQTKWLFIIISIINLIVLLIRNIYKKSEKN